MLTEVISVPCSGSFCTVCKNNSAYSNNLICIHQWKGYDMTNFQYILYQEAYCVGLEEEIGPPETEL